MATHVDIDDIQTTRGEKLLAAVLTVFLLTGGIWAYYRLDVSNGYAPPSYTSSEQQAIRANDAAQQRVFAANEQVRAARSALELSREAYRTALEAHQPAATLGATYRRNTARFQAAQVRTRQAQSLLQSTAPAARAAYDRANRDATARTNRNDRETFLLRLGFVLASLAACFWIFSRLRRTRYGPLSASGVAAATLLAFVMAVDYVTDYVGWRDLGPLVLSVAGIVLTILAFWGLQRYLSQRIPPRRVRKSECPFCGYPVRGDGPHCEGCGRDVVAECATCTAPRRVGTAHCAVCGSN